MSGHSKWHNIQAKKGKADAKKGKIFTKIGKELAIAAKTGGSNPDNNAKLRDVIAKAKANNMPQDTVNRAIKKGAGEMEGVNYEEIVYEGYGPAGVAIIVKALTDNKNRTASSVRAAFSRHGGNLGANGCVSWMFQTKGQIIIERKDDIDEDEIMMQALDAGAEDFDAQDEVFEIITAAEDFGKVREKLETEGFDFLSADITMIPDNTVSVDMETAEKVQNLIDKLEEDDDVQDVYHNADFPEEFEG
ncbi:YebC/PmpR family DNA-binding transcriptional regulator [Clostridium luticellarii]|jgi:YebC/PmpR family DNA-binding regulatory protein|uniref:Probable transcriptional regulatory protein CLLU_22380 n=1 Tax=Clostridium luticellarii TaxID=1691940 RepID=A0A2T0BLQ8_9CLOT|nr:YebC/PmpR family DNA-binding transcriptional regulator [Clostridium luticellarii]MCI1944303.1 YebC/PmpR family DNA-binding transcriptional regulator [Clostridium luticellarii]MCI1967799.1 YebC/PmpR family DNA-binding transcriptional regulator [Clostridium luticellarii]MCI1994677.1 YebC/PmpR family DNA-binding transcriptional regulator [Clostridium luticellarii]MCI2038826.1 YebC/PmpR family DNA-binding transcriptional regulator [Clostridium luticellarii]PRR84773.1 putative transcriptional re